jgi:hypothetical protein
VKSVGTVPPWFNAVKWSGTVLTCFNACVSFVVISKIYRILETFSCYNRLVLVSVSSGGGIIDEEVATTDAFFWVGFNFACS